ncbi:MAG: 50S ribosomal protein L21 [Actinobacteria bacterium]|nr:50S ribosomal protein L21 [Actinomycetota bacterium]
MYAILEDGSKQYQISQGDTIDIETRVIPEGQNTIEFDRVLLVKDDKGTQVGTPIVPGAKVIARINSPVKGPKIKIFKLRRRKNSSTRVGHRQKYLRVTIDNISV